LVALPEASQSKSVRPLEPGTWGGLRPVLRERGAEMPCATQLSARL
jgi:hypothetical protein